MIKVLEVNKLVKIQVRKRILVLSKTKIEQIVGTVVSSVEELQEALYNLVGEC